MKSRKTDPAAPDRYTRVALPLDRLSPWLDHSPREDPAAVRTIVLHATACPSLADAVAVLRQRGLSYHFIIDHDGATLECCPRESTAFHAGNSYGPEHAEAGVSREQTPSGTFVAEPSVNRTSVGVSFQSLDRGEPITPAQRRAILDLVPQIRAAYPTVRYLTTHALVSPLRKTDPKGVDLAELAALTGLEVWPPA